MQDPTPTTAIDSRALDAVHQELRRRDIDLNLYNLSYYETPESFLILADYKERNPRLRGSDPQHPSYEVLVSRADLSITRVSVVR